MYLGNQATFDASENENDYTDEEDEEEFKSDKNEDSDSSDEEIEMTPNECVPNPSIKDDTPEEVSK